jgi:hypothetical protein
MVIRQQNTMPAQPNAQNARDARSSEVTMTKKFVTPNRQADSKRKLLSFSF